MRKLVCPTITIAILFSLIACGRKSDDTGNPGAYDTAGVPIVQSNTTREADSCVVAVAPSVSIGAADGAPEYLLDRVRSATRLSDGRIVVSHDGAKELRYYDSAGKYLLTAGRKGEGPGEFRSPFDLFAMPGDTVWAGDYRPWRFLVFSPEGKWVRTVEPNPIYPNPPDTRGILADGRLVLSDGKENRGGSGFSADTIELRLYTKSGERTMVLGRFPNGRWGQVEGSPIEFYTYPVFESFARIAVGSDRIAVSSSTDPNIHILNPDATLRQIIRWETADRTVRQADIDAYRETEMERAATMDPEGRLHQLSQASEKRPVAERFAAVAAMSYGNDGRLWVRPARRPGDSLPISWLAFEENGAFACRVHLPQGLQVFEFGADYILGLSPDSLDVQRVVLHPMRALKR